MSDTAAAFTTAATEPLAANQWDMRLIHADEANAVSGGSRDVLVGVLDSGIDATHPDLAPNVDAANSVGCTSEGVPDTSPAAWLPTNSSHGTHVAGSIAAAQNGIGIAGVAPGVRIASVKVVDDDGFIYPEYAICGFVWAARARHAGHQQLLLRRPMVQVVQRRPRPEGRRGGVRRAIEYAAKNDVVNVVALGNFNWDLSHELTDNNSPNNQTPTTRVVGNNCPTLPAEVKGVVGVSSVGPTAEKAYYSSYGASDTEVAAPGGDRFKTPATPDGNGRVLSTIVGGGYGYMPGHLDGLAPCGRSRGADPQHASRLVGQQGHQGAEDQADKLACPANPYNPTGDGAWLATCEGGASGKGFYGAGLIDALDAVTE